MVLSVENRSRNADGEMLTITMAVNRTGTLMQFSIRKHFRFATIGNSVVFIIFLLLFVRFPDFRFFFTVLFLFVYSIFRVFGVRKETILVSSNLGIQITKFYGFNLNTISFVPWTLIDDVVLNEVIFRNKVIFLLTIIKKTNDNKTKKIPVPVFEEMLPRFKCLLQMYRHIKNCN